MPPGLESATTTEVDVRYYAHVLWRGRALVATSALVGLVLAALVIVLQTPQYQAAATIQIDPPTPTFLSVSDALMGAGGYLQNADFYNTQFQILRSKSLGQKVVEHLKLTDMPPFKGTPDPGGMFMAHVAIEPVPESRLVLVQVIHQNPREAALWANSLADTYVDQSLSNRVEAAKKAYDWLQERLAATHKSMLEAQDRLFKNYQSQDLFVPEGSVSAVTTSITKLNEDYIGAQSRRISLEAALNQVGEMRKRGQSLDTVPQVATDSMALNFNGQIESLKIDLSRLKEKYKEAHPEIQKVEAQIEQLRKAKEARANQIVEGIKADYAQNQRREAELKEAIDTQKAQAAMQSRKGTELETIKKEADSAKNLYDVLLQKLNETDIAASIRNNNVAVVERATAPISPVRPSKRQIITYGLLLGVLLGVALVFGQDYLDNTLKDPDEVERFLHLDLVASVPRYEEANVPFVTEAYQNVRTALVFDRKESRGHVVLVTGSAPQEGKTTTLVNVAKLLATAGEKTLVIDFDLRRASMHTRLGLAREPGVTSFFVQHMALDGLIRPTRFQNLFALTAGALPPNPPAILTRKSMAELFEALRAQFDWVLVDSPPLASVTDALLLGRHVDTVLVVVQHNKVDKRVVKRCVNALRKAEAPVLGVVLNAVDEKTQGHYYYYYHQQDGAQAVAAGESRPKVVSTRRG